MSYSAKQTVLLVKIETTSGTDAVPTTAADAVAIRVDDFKAKIEEKFAENELATGAFGAPDQIPYTRRGTISFSVPWQGSGTAGTAAAWRALMLGCATSETVTAATRVDILPASAALKTCSIYAYVNGQLEKFVYAAGSFKLSCKVGEVPLLSFSFTALVTSVAAAAAPTNAVLTAYKRPQAFGAAYSTGLVIGGAYAAGAITGGTTFPLQEFTLDSGNDVQDVEMAGTESVGVYDWAPKVSLVADISAAQMATLYDNMHTGTTISVGFSHGTVAGLKGLCFAPSCQLTAIDDKASSKVLLNGLELTCGNTSALNDAWRLVML